MTTTKETKMTGFDLRNCPSCTVDGLGRTPKEDISLAKLEGGGGLEEQWPKAVVHAFS